MSSPCTPQPVQTSASLVVPVVPGNAAQPPLLRRTNGVSGETLTWPMQWIEHPGLVIISTHREMF